MPDAGLPGPRAALLARTRLFEGLTDGQRDQLAARMDARRLAAGELLVREGDPGTELYVIAEGEVQVLKREPATGESHEIARLGPGESIGELALIDPGPRSASVRAVVPTTVLAISADTIEALGREQVTWGEIFGRLSREVAARLRYTNEVTVRSLRLQVAMGTFLTFIIFCLSIYAFVLQGVARYAAVLGSTTLVTVGLLVLLTGACLEVMRRLGYPRSFYGLTLAGWRRAVGESLGCTVLLCAAIVLLKWSLVRGVASFAGEPIFNPYAAFKSTAGTGLDRLSFLLAMAGLYVLHAPLQELLVRGGLQSTLQQFLAGRGRPVVAIVGSNLIFGAFHLHISLPFALVSLVPGLLWGWLYARHGTLVGVTISHMLTGLWAVFVVGIEGVIL